MKKQTTIPALNSAVDKRPIPTEKDGRVIDPDVVEILDELPIEKREVMVRAFEAFSGPIPHPSILRGYDCVKEGFAERIVLMAEKEQEHRHKCEDMIIKESTATSKREQLIGFVIAILFLIVAGILGMTDHAVVASIIGGGTLVSLVTVFVTSNKSSQNDNREHGEEKHI